ncbi:unnamed protein product [Caenorhabditis nigoni]
MRLVICNFLLVAQVLAAQKSSIGPPKLLDQSEEEVWYHLDDDDLKNRLTLKCDADENTDRYSWLKDGEPFEINSDDVVWEKESQSGSIVFMKPHISHQGYYQCFASNIFGTALSNKMHLRLGSLEHFPKRDIQILKVKEGESLTLNCTPPRGIPPPKIIWLYRSLDDSSVIETIRSRHITVDNNGRLHFSSVELSDGKPTLVYECAATSPVLRGEYRSGDRVQLDIEPSQDKSYPVKKLSVSPSEVTVRAGGQLKLQCVFGGRPLPTIFWSKVDGELPKSRIKDLTTHESDFGRSLIVENVHPDDAGVYECRGRHLVHTVNVRVMAAPFWEFEPPRDISLPEESTGELECLAGGQPTPIITWSMNGKFLHELAEDSRRVLLDNGRILRVRSLNHDLDTGVYQCNASNPLGYVFANAFVHVRAHAPFFRMPAARHWKVVLHSTVILDCDVDAAPEAIVRWVDADDRPLQVVEGKNKLFPNHTFMIYDVNSADEGLYYCNVSNKYGINRATNRLQVFKPTYFVRIPTPKRLILEAGETAEVFCEAVADPRLPIKYQWTINGKVLTESKYYEILPDRLRFRSVRGRHSGIIDCAAITDVDVKLASMQLIVKDVPAHPVVEAAHCSERKATIKWVAASDHGDSIKKYIVEMFTDFKKNEWEVINEEVNVNKENFEVDITLTPWVNYTFRVVAVNSHGRSDMKIDGQPKEDWLTCQTRPSFPYTNPTGVKGEGTEPDNLVISWKPLDRYYWNAPNMQYLVRYKLDEPIHGWTEFLVEDSLANFTIIRDQPTFRKYLIQVQSVNSVGPSIVEPEIHHGWSGEDVPDEAPRDFRIDTQINFTTINFTWNPVHENTVNGHFVGYEIEYWKAENTVRKYSIKIPANSTYKIMNSFHAVTNYSAHIRTRNKRLRSAPSHPVSFAMPEGPPGKVHNLRVYSVGSTAILLQWDAPLQPNGRIRGYFISFQNDKNETEETYVIHRQKYYLHEKSEPDTGYKVTVWAETRAGEGPTTLRPVRTWPPRIPDAPTFRVKNISLDSFVVEWLPNNHSVWKMPGAAFFVNYTAESSNTWHQSEIIYLPNTEILLRNLKEDQKYFIQGIAKDGPRQSESVFLPIKTLNRDYANRLKEDSLRSAAWFIAVLGVLGIGLFTICLTFCCGNKNRQDKFAVRRKEIEIGHQQDNEEEKQFLEYQYGFKN